MLDRRPRLVKPPARVSPLPPPPATPQKPKGPSQTPPTTFKRVDYDGYRLLVLARFERRLLKYPDGPARQQEVLPYFRDMIAAAAVRSRPVSSAYKRWLFRVDRDVAARDLFRVVFEQHCASVTWTPEP
jgi:hypothetical protein